MKNLLNYAIGNFENRVIWFKANLVTVLLDFFQDVCFFAYFYEKNLATYMAYLFSYALYTNSVGRYIVYLKIAPE